MLGHKTQTDLQRSPSQRDEVKWSRGEERLTHGSETRPGKGERVKLNRRDHDEDLRKDVVGRKEQRDQFRILHLGSGGLHSLDQIGSTDDDDVTRFHER